MLGSKEPIAIYPKFWASHLASSRRWNQGQRWLGELIRNPKTIHFYDLPIHRDSERGYSDQLHLTGSNGFDDSCLCFAAKLTQSLICDNQVGLGNQIFQYVGDEFSAATGIRWERISPQNETKNADKKDKTPLGRLAAPMASHFLGAIPTKIVMDFVIDDGGRSPCIYSESISLTNSVQ